IAKEEVERKRKAEEEAEKRRKADEAEKERKRVEIERERQAEIERQRLKNERDRQAARQAEIDAESNRLDAIQANAETAYMFAIQQRISRRWVRPPTATTGTECVVKIRQLPGGEVVSVSVAACNRGEEVRLSIEAAVRRASPLPVPEDPSVFDRDIRLTFRPED
ncbi:MAG: cell envelope integrity protein TolA, partial [Woeseiaceae bacterium]|nr:cell envelope integrity protein TolA [Woeseiaceae bacterium]MDX2609093.1 cell envelope integrity protein TolA [Woeseiaceae bacterium]